MPDTPVVTWRAESAGVTLVTLARPPANALGLPILEGMHAAIDAAEAAGDVKVMVVSSDLDGFFAAGADIKHLSTIDAESFLAYGDTMRAVNDRLAASPWISIAAIDGLALGGGLELAMACTLRVAGARARLGLPEVKLGLIPGAGGTQRLPQLVGRGRALDIMLTARQVGADEALAIGLVDRLTDGDVVRPPSTSPPSWSPRRCRPSWPSSAASTRRSTCRSPTASRSRPSRSRACSRTARRPRASRPSSPSARRRSRDRVGARCLSWRRAPAG